jgi:hypothetical protein
MAMSNQAKYAGIGPGGIPSYAQKSMPRPPVGSNLIQPAVDANPNTPTPTPRARLPIGSSGMAETSVSNPSVGWRGGRTT